MICAAPGHTLIGADFSSIESRVLAWVAGEEWKLDSYRRFDATRDPRDEPYCITACKIFRVPDGSFDKSSPERERRQNLRSGVRIHGRSWCVAEIRTGSLHRSAKWKQFKTNGALRIRRSNDSGTTIDRAAWTAVRDRGRVVRCGPVAFKCDGAFLQLKLPSGRKLFYPLPRISRGRAQPSGCVCR